MTIALSRACSRSCFLWFNSTSNAILTQDYEIYDFYYFSHGKYIENKVKKIKKDLIYGPRYVKIYLLFWSSIFKIQGKVLVTDFSNWKNINENYEL